VFKQRKRVGLALGGGAVRGLAHLGVLAVLEREAIPVDYLAGTSVGSLIGTMFCAGLSVAELEYIASHIGWRHMARPVRSRQGLLSFSKLESLIRELLGDLTFADLDIPMAIVTADMNTGQTVVLTEGALAPAIVASCCVPGLVEPRALNGYLLGDGGIVNNIPASVVRDMGADYVIAVDIFEPRFRLNSPLGIGFTALEILVDRAGEGYKKADCLITPHLAGMSYFLFRERQQLIDRGREATECALPGLRLALS
jgi:NTE family protein